MALGLALSALVLVIIPPEHWARFQSLSHPTQAIAVLWFLALLALAVSGVALCVRIARAGFAMLMAVMGDTQATARADRVEYARVGERRPQTWFWWFWRW